MLWFRRDLSEPNLRPAATHRFMQLIAFVRSATAHYAPLREAMLWSLDQCLGEQFTPQMRRARGQACDRLAVAMVEPLATTAPPTRSRR